MSLRDILMSFRDNLMSFRDNLVSFRARHEFRLTSDRLRFFDCANSCGRWSALRSEDDVARLNIEADQSGKSRFRQRD